MNILIAPNAYKNSLDASAAAAAIKKGLDASRLDCHCILHPIADGGDGTAELLIQRLEAARIPVSVCDPLGRTIRAEYGITRNGTAIIEMAAASGIRLLQQAELDPLHANSLGTGQLIGAALDKGARTIILAIGGSATVDGGIGILHALGARLLDGKGQIIQPVPGRLFEVKTLDLRGLDPRIKQTSIQILCDVDNILTGPQGSAAVFGPQKGASPEMVKELDAALTKLAVLVDAATGKDIPTIKHGGAAGGVAAGLNAILDAQLVNGAEAFLDITGFEGQLSKAGLVITGEGSLDAQTLQGKGPYAVARAAKQLQIPVIGMAGKIAAATSPQLNEYFQAIFAIGGGPEDLQTALQQTAQDLERTATMVGNLLALRRKD